MPHPSTIVCRSIAKFALSLALSFAAGLAMAADSPGKLELKTTAFRAGSTIPTRFTCSGENISPALSWNQGPALTQGFVLIVDDPDAPAGTWVHWVVYNLPASARRLPEHVPPGEAVAGGGKQGLNDFSQNDYGGPCPPPGKPHHYFFRLYALDTILDLRAPVHRSDINAAMKSHVLAQAEWMGTFGR
jgi:Raf kinase inhibitor-like YbhB/YbcL family protein